MSGVREALEGLITAWEATKAGNTTKDEIQRWLIEDMKPAVDHARAVLAASSPLTDAARDVLLERHRQVNSEGWTPEHDDQRSNKEMAYAAACYLGPIWPHESDGALGLPPIGWKWGEEWYKPGGEGLMDYRRRLIKGTALGLAEIERVDRARARS